MTAAAQKTSRKRLQTHRRGQADIPIVMIFAVTAGVFILLLAGYFVLRQQSAASDRAQLEDLIHVRDSLASLQGSPSTTQELSFPGAPYTIRCDEDNSELLIKAADGGDEQSLDGILLATPVNIASSVQVTTANAGASYRIGTFVYMIPKGTKIEVDAPINFPFPITQGSGPTLTTITHTAPDGSIATLTVTPDLTTPTAGTVTFADGVSYPYFDTNMLAAAAVANDSVLYSCMLDRYVQLLAFNNALQHKRIAQLKQDAIDSGSTCAETYETSSFEEIETILGTDPSIATLVKGRDLTVSNDAPQIAAALNTIAEMNGKLLRGDRCATVN